MKKILLLTVILILQPIYSADKRIADFANECSALFLLMTMIADDQFKAFSDNMGQLSETMGLITAGIAEENNKILTNGELIDARNIQADRIIAMYQRNPTSVLGLYARCDNFRENFAYAAMQNPNNDSELLNSLSMPPNKVSMSDQKTALIEMALETSFADMQAAGIYSIVEFYKKLRNP